VLKLIVCPQDESTSVVKKDSGNKIIKNAVGEDKTKELKKRNMWFWRK
jgi:hypothetical protein